VGVMGRGGGEAVASLMTLTAAQRLT